MVSRRQEFKALGKWMCQIRPIGKEYKFKVIGEKGKEIEIGITGLESGSASVSVTSRPLVYKEKYLFTLISLFDEKKITLDEVIRLRKLVHAQAESGKK